MILVAGNDGAVVAAVDAALTAAARPHARTDHLDFQTVLESGATTLVLVEELPRLYADAVPRGGGLPEADGIAGMVRAASAPSVRRVIVVTTRPDEAPELRALRRSGAPYVILRPALLLDRALVAGAAESILVPRPLARTRASALPLPTLVDAITDALDAPVVGRTLAVEPSAHTTWVDALAQMGAQPRVVGSWRARVARWLGAPILDGLPLTPSA